MSKLATAEPGFEERVRESFERQEAMRTIGAELTRVSPGMIEIEMPFADILTPIFEFFSNDIG